MNKGLGLKLSILSISFLLMTRLTIAPALAEIGKAFPSVSQESLMMMVVIPSLVGIIFGFIGSILAGYMRVKTLLYIGLAGYLAGGIGPVFTNNYNSILVCRVLLGAGTGLFLPFTSGLIASCYKGSERNQMIGFQSTSVGFGNIITSILAGILAAVYWKLSFLIYAFGFMTLCFVIVYLKEPEKQGEKQKLTAGMYLNPKVIWVCFTLFLYAILYFSFFGYISFVIDENQFGDAKAAGFTTMLMTLGSMLMGIAYGRVFELLGRFSLIVSIILNIAGFMILAQASGITHIFAGAFILGTGFGILMPYAVTLINIYSDKAAYNYSNGLLMVAVNVGTAVAPAILVTVGKAFGDSGGQFIFKFCAMCMVLAGVLSLLWLFAPRKSSSLKTAVKNE